MRGHVHPRTRAKGVTPNTTNISSLKVLNHERRYKKTPFCVPTVPKIGQIVWIPIASVRILAVFRTDAMLKKCYAIQGISYLAQ